MAPRDDVDSLFRALLARWNERDASGFGELFSAEGSMVGFDGTSIERPAAIVQHLQSIFADHEPGRYVAKVRELRPLSADVMLVRAVAGMVPPGQQEIKPEVNAVQVVVAVAGSEGWEIAHYQNTPAAFDGRPEEARALTAELTEVLTESD